VRESYGKFAGIVGIITNIILFAIKITAGLFSNSISIIADAVNNLSDSGSSIITLVGFKISGKPADAKHPYGHARMEYISGLIVSFIILFLGGQLVLTSADKIIHPRESVFSPVLLFILIVSILIKVWQSLFYRKIAKLIDSTTLMATSMDSRNDIMATSSVLAAVILTRLTGFNLDGYMGVGVAIFILISGIRLIQDTISPLLGMAPTRELVDEIYKKILSYDGIVGLHDLAVHSYGAGKCFASVHCEVPAEQDIMVSHDVIDNIERDFLKDMDIHLVIHLDPIVIEDEKTNELREAVSRLISELSPELGMHDFRVVRGVSHSNLIFDVVAAFDFHWSDEEIVKRITDAIHKMDPSLHAVITVDHAYIPAD
jgi:cation diffusion facilitator family transporter